MYMHIITAAMRFTIGGIFKLEAFEAFLESNGCLLCSFSAEGLLLSAISATCSLHDCHTYLLGMLGLALFSFIGLFAL